MRRQVGSADEERHYVPSVESGKPEFASFYLACEVHTYLLYISFSLHPKVSSTIMCSTHGSKGLLSGSFPWWIFLCKVTRESRLERQAGAFLSQDHVIQLRLM
jgi:hypothetical protein